MANHTGIISSIIGIPLSIGAYASIIENESQTGKMHQSFSSPIDFNVHNSVFLSRAKIRFCMLVSLVLNTEDAHSSVL